MVLVPSERDKIARLAMAMCSLKSSPLPKNITRILREEFSAAISISALGPAKFVLDAAEEVIELSKRGREENRMTTYQDYEGDRWDERSDGFYVLSVSPENTDPDPRMLEEISRLFGPLTEVIE